MKRTSIIAGVLALTACIAAAQDIVFDQIKLKQAADDKAKAELGAVLQKAQVIGIEGGLMSNVKGAPYSAEQIRENTQTLSDGTHINNQTAVKLYRDGQGRVRRDTPEMISIFDPVAGVGYTLNPKTLTGSKIHVSVSVKTGPNNVSYTATASSGDGREVHVVNEAKTATITGQAATVRASGGGAGSDVVLPFFFSAEPGVVSISGSQMKVAGGSGKAENLGTQTMEGVSVQGERRSHTIEAGQIGNDRPIQIVEEHWYSPDLQMDIMNRHVDPRTGEQTMRVVNIQRGEPDPSLFQPPAEYQISDRLQPLKPRQ